MATNDDLRKLCGILPVPLAELVRRALNGKRAVERHHCAFYLAEATLKLATAARIGLYIDRALVPGSDLAFRLETAAFGSIGHWVELLRKVNAQLEKLPDAALLPLACDAKRLDEHQPGWEATQTFAREAQAAGAINPDVGKQGIKRGAVGFFELVAAYRNEGMGHGSMRSNAFYQTCGSALLEACGEVLSLPALFALEAPADLSEHWWPVLDDAPWLALHSVGPCVRSFVGSSVVV